MEEIEHLIQVVRQKRLVKQCELERLNAEVDEDCRKLLEELRDLRREREKSKDNIAKHLNTITSHKHAIQKIVHSTNDISGLPVPHDYAQDMKTLFSDAIEFLNNAGDIHKTLANNEKNNVDPSQLIQDMTTCTETVRMKIYEIKRRIAQVETLKDNIAAFQQYIMDSSDNIEDETINLTITNNNSADSGSTIT